MDPFGTVLIAVVVVAIVVACLSYVGSESIYRDLGQTGVSLDEPDMPTAPAAGSPAAHAEAEEEIRQMLEAKSARRVRRGEDPLDVEPEVDRRLLELTG